MKEKLHKFLFPKQDELIEKLKNELMFMVEIDAKSLNPHFDKLENLYKENKDTFHRLMIEEFTGEIPISVKEPAFEIFNTQAEDIERWVLWQSYKMRRLVMLHPANPLKIEYYDGALFFLKFFLELSHFKRTEKTLKPSTQSNKSIDIPIEDTVPKTLQDFREGIRKKYENQEIIPDSEVIPTPDEPTDDTIKA